MTSLHKLFFVGLVSTTLLVACGTPPEPEEVAQRSSSIISTIVQQTADSLQSLEDLQELESLFNGLDLAGLWPGEEEIQAPEAAPAESSGLDLDLDQVDTQEIKRVLEQHIFHPDNVESTDGDSITFLLDGQRLCSEVGTQAQTCAAGPGAAEPSCSSAVDQDCIDVVDKLQVRITARLLGEKGVELSISLGGQGTLITITLQPDEAEVRLTLDSARQTVAHVAQVVGEPLPELPEAMSGAVSAALKINGPQDVTLKLGVPSTVRVKGSVDQGGYRLGLEQRDPLAALRVTAASKSVELSMDWGALDLELPAGAVWEGATGQLQLLLQGWTSTLIAAAGQPLQIKGIGLGDAASWLKLNGQTLMELDLNAGSGRTFDLLAEPVDGMPLCTVTPELDLQAWIHLSPLQSYLEDPLPDWALDERYSLQLQSSQGSPVVLPVEQTPSYEGGLKVVQGSLILKSHNNPHTVQVSQGSCMTYIDDLGPGDHPPLSHLIAGPCP